MYLLEYNFIFVALIFLFSSNNATETTWLIFSNYLITRDEAQYCCAMYGMSLMSVDTAQEQTFLQTSFLPVVGTTGAYWLGVFSDDSTTEAYNVKKQPFNFTNWDETSFSPENTGPNGTIMFNSTICVKGDLSNNMAWQLTGCDEKLPYVCELTANDTTDMVDVGEQSVQCPILQKFRSSNLSRQGNIIYNGKAYAGTEGWFTKEAKITHLGSQLGGHIVNNYHDCLILCLHNALCSDIVLVSGQACLLYQG